MLFARQALLSSIALALVVRSTGQIDELSWHVENSGLSDDLVPTYRTPVERGLQSLAAIFDGVSKTYSRNSGNGVASFFNKFAPNSLKSALTPSGERAVRGFGDWLNRFAGRFHAVYPGTYWCGAGNIASDENGVGLFRKTDACCRAHDQCGLNIEAGKSLGRLLNSGGFTRSACSCDLDFYNCLKNVKSPISMKIGFTYFNVLRPQCFGFDHPIEKCSQYAKKRTMKAKCIKYDLDRSKNKRLEWFDTPDFLD
ncbi:phospholipase A2-like [Venturia canescens]|uniref:phospholipase A2-like n=1 Tax=Venturia canescens TaxID=32260 RepID=UPI001C9C2230|nr:phospholipase A2-like [Venturia canescens]